jgi:hypothetical protein
MILALMLLFVLVFIAVAMLGYFPYKRRLARERVQLARDGVCMQDMPKSRIKPALELMGAAGLISFFVTIVLGCALQLFVITPNHY